MDAPPIVTVIVPAYNYARFLPAALDSVLAQSFRDWECVIVDDGSTDDTPAVARSWVERDRRFRYVRQENRGLAGARNTAIAQSRGTYLQFLDADDLLAPDKLARHAAFLNEHVGTDIVYSEVGFFRSETPGQWMASMGGRLSRSIMARVHGADEAREKLQHYNIMPVLAALVRRSVIERAGTFDEAAPACEDYGFWIRCAAAGCRFDYYPTDTPLSAVRVHDTSMSRDQRRMAKGLIAIATAFDASPLRREWCPLIYEVALAYDAVGRGSRLGAARRIWSAAGRATEALTGWRWRVYAAAALLLPRERFLRFVGTSIPETPFELYRRSRRAISRLFRRAP